ncbi:geranylgeranylglyceryl/heptaprenylglyceryl phosphate synthase [Candidatus Parcubacteria bacterium]|nr:geranylgeranylglyceryl/heptaprenylglyceryl phosphate synthase [Candidatus Parcubacteria bacterium]
MKVFEYLMDKLEKERLHFTLIDPEKQNTKRSKDLARVAKEAGTDAIMVGGSTPIEQKILDRTVIEVKKTELPVILFPSSANFLSRYANAIFFLSLSNSKDRRYLVGEQVKGVSIIKKIGIEPISVGYILVKPGMKVGEIGRADLIQREDIDLAARYALTAQYFGMKFVYLEAGSGSLLSVPDKMIAEVKRNIDIPLIVGGGIRSDRIAKEKLKAGADILVTGNIIEGQLTKLQDIILATKRGKVGIG